MTKDQICMAGESLRVRGYAEVSAKRERSLTERCSCGVIHRYQRTNVVRCPDKARQVADVESGIGRRFQPYEAGA